MPASELLDGTDAFLLIDSEEISLKQLEKDFARERVVINGRRLVGSRDKLEGVCAALEHCIDMVTRISISIICKSFVEEHCRKIYLMHFPLNFYLCLTLSNYLI